MMIKPLDHLFVHHLIKQIEPAFPPGCTMRELARGAIEQTLARTGGIPPPRLDADERIRDLRRALAPTLLAACVLASPPPAADAPVPRATRRPA